MKKLLIGIGRLVGWIARVIVGIGVVVFLLVVAAGAAIGWHYWHGPPVEHIGSGIALVIHPYGSLSDLPQGRQQRLVERVTGERPRSTSLQMLREALRAAAKDPRIKLAVLDFDDMTGAGVAQLQELSRSIAAFRSSDKAVYAFGHTFDEYQYLPAVQADSISLDPAGAVFIQGFGVYGDYFKDALDKLGVTVNVFRVGKYKSAVEPFIRNDMSPAAKQANVAWLGELWSAYQQDVTGRRMLPGAALDGYVAGLSKTLVAHGGDAATLALDDRLVNRLQTHDQFRESMEKLVGTDARTHSFRQISARGYLRSWRHEHPIDPHLPKIAVIDAQGDIVDGRGNATDIGGETYARLFDAATHSRAVKAVVLRINSPGGSASAAQRIGRAEARLKAAGKPFVVSMSTMAASGGYWISMGADRIYAEPTTITGSIGIFALVPNLTPLLTKLGIHSDGVGTTPLAGAFRMDAPLTDEQSALIQSRVDFGYAEFTQGVARGRHTTLSDVDRIAQGRVWSGAAAKQRGLVDAFGGLHAAVVAAASLAHLEPDHYAIEKLSAVGGAAQLIGHFLHPRLSIRAAVAAASGLPRAWSGPLVTAADELKAFNDPHDEYAYCFCQVAPATVPPG